MALVPRMGISHLPTLTRLGRRYTDSKNSVCLLFLVSFQAELTHTPTKRIHFICNKNNKNTKFSNMFGKIKLQLGCRKFVFYTPSYKTRRVFCMIELKSLCAAGRNVLNERPTIANL